MQQERGKQKFVSFLLCNNFKNRNYIFVLFYSIFCPNAKTKDFLTDCEQQCGRNVAVEGP